MFSGYENYIYKIEEGTNKTCYENCPSEKPYHNSNNECLDICPEETPFHEIGEYECKREMQCSGNYIDYDSKTCLSNTQTKCPASKKITTIINGDTKYLCSNKCISKYGGYATPYNTCVKNCETESNKYLKNDEANKKCICKNLYFIDEETFIMTCFDTSETDCKNTEFTIKMNGSNQCLKICNNNKILSPSEDVCYEESYQCPKNTKLIMKNDEEKKCDCIYKYYYNGNQKICLNENDVCPEGYQKYIPDTMQCIKIEDDCPDTYPYLFKDFCLNKCPKGSTEIDHTCDCNNFWYEISNGNYECLEGDCLDSFPFYSPSTKQCLKTCKGSYYPILFENKSYSSCTIIPNTEKIEIFSNYAFYKCDCLDPWYYNSNHEMICPERGTIVKCSDYNLNIDYMIKDTRECVIKCQGNNAYSFNKACFPSCESANYKYRLNIEDDGGSFECKCQNLWYYDPVDNEKIICYDKNINECPPLSDPSTSYLINSTKQCVDNVEKCPINSYKFNHICYDKCPIYTIDQINDINEKTCICNKIDNTVYPVFHPL